MTHNPVIFLDFDGVLNHNDLEEGEIRFEKENVKNFNSLLQNSPADVVVISAWRNNMGVNDLRDLFNDYGLPGERIISKSNDIDGRGNEISGWLSDHPEVKSYVVIDDDDTDLESFRDSHVRPESSKGMSIQDADKAERILMGQV